MSTSPICLHLLTFDPQPSISVTLRARVWNLISLMVKRALVGRRRFLVAPYASLEHRRATFLAQRKRRIFQEGMMR
jgi:hypothetical protein